MALLDDLDEFERQRAAEQEAQAEAQSSMRGWEPGLKYGPDGIPTEVTTLPIPNVDVAGITKAVEAMGVFLPKGYRFVIAEAKLDTAAWHRDNAYSTHPATGKQVKTPAVTRPTWRYRLTTTLDKSEIDLPALYAEVARTTVPTRSEPLPTGTRSAVVVFADPQFGKQDHRGGTKKLLERLTEKRAALEAYLQSSGCSRGFFLDAGDGPESFENVPSQAHLNDLSFPNQIDAYATEAWKMIRTMAEFFPVESAIVPSNHAAWRNGKQTLGKPEDDWGIHVHRRLRERAEDTGLDVKFHFPGPWEESIALKLPGGTVIGMHHGHQASPLKAPEFWAGQQHGGGPLANADILVTGHYHHFIALPTGRNAKTQRSKWWLQSPTLDNGSSWWRNRKGDDSDPGLLVFTVTERGLDLQTLTIL